MAYDLKQESEVKDYIENLGIEYRFGCYKENKPEVCHLLGDYLEAVKKDFTKAGKVYKSNCLDNNFGKSCLKYGNYLLIGRGVDANCNDALTYFEKGCDAGERGACLHAGMLLTSTGPKPLVKNDTPRGYNYLKKSCDLKDDMGCHYLSGMYMTGVPKNVADFNPHNPEKNKDIDYLIKRDMTKAYEFAMKACEYGNYYACANVSLMYRKGEGVEQNLEESKKYFKLAKELQEANQNTKELRFQQGLDEKK